VEVPRMTGPCSPDPGDVLPYGHPALQVDRVLWREPRRLVATKAITYYELDNHLGDCRPGSFPASLMIESFLQTCGMLISSEPAAETSHLPILASARNIRVLGAARAGDLLVHTIELVDRYEDTATFTGTSRVGDDLVLSVVRAMILLRPANTLAHGNR
jgi:3-hydroxymyristoyl/3-hydroxydecanoyl-(acyl carrier protein) dehydratase